MTIRRIDIYRTKLALKTPYHLRFGVLKELDTLLVRVEISDRAFGWAETTPLFGYSRSSMDMAIKSTKELAGKWLTMEPEEIFAAGKPQMDGFLYTCLYSAIEEACGLIPNIEGSVPIVGILQEMENESFEETLSRLRADGYRCFKLKAGLLDDMRDEIRRIRTIQECLMFNETIRVDANQSLTFNGAHRLADAMDPEKVELFEQPFCLSCFTESALLKTFSPVPIMLDESITDEKSLDKAAAEQSCDFVKFKWMKQGGFGPLSEMTDKAMKLGFKVVLGNGVSGWLSNRHEAIFWLERLKDSGIAGELNGFLKILSDNFSNFIRFENGKVVIRRIDPDTLDRKIGALEKENILSITC